MRKSFRSSITIGFAAMVLLCTVVGFLAFAIGVNLQKVFRDTIRENVSALKAAEELELALLGQKGFMSNYILSGNPTWLERLEDKRTDFLNWLKKASDVALTAPEKGIIQDIKPFMVYTKMIAQQLNGFMSRVIFIRQKIFFWRICGRALMRSIKSARTLFVSTSFLSKNPGIRFRKKSR